MEKRELTPGYAISPVIKGGWQLSSGHSLDQDIEDAKAIADTTEFIEAGITTLDFGDIYTGVEDLIGKSIFKLRETHGERARDLVQLHTKYVPNEAFLHSFDKTDVAVIVNRSLQRLGVDQVDMVQFHWWNYEAKQYLSAMEELFELKSDGKIRHVGVTNFDVARLSEMVDAGFKPASIQLQYSLLDARAEGGMVDYCLANEIGIFCYGTVAGGFFSERFLGAAEPTHFDTRSNVKYQLIIKEFGGWPLFQRLLKVLASISEEHGTDIGTIASAYIVNRPGVKAVIVGARNLSHLESNLRIPEIEFTESQLELIKEILAISKGPSGPIYYLERYDDEHRNIMHTNNN
jgi:aryl-alcohol dehydrogenase-like predicted oxidoreductase